MAQATFIAGDKRESAVRSLNAIYAEAEDLPNLQAEWDTFSVHQQIDSSTDWSHLLADYWPEVKQAFERGELTGEQERAYRRIVGVFEQHEAFLETLGVLVFLKREVPYDPDFDIP